MINFSLKRAVAVAILAGASVGAHATTTNLGTISSSVLTATGIAGTALGAGQSFSDIFSFNFSGSNFGTHFLVNDVPTIVSPQVNFDGILSAISLFSAGANGVVGGGDDSLLASSTAPGGNSLTLDYNQSLSGTSYITVTGITNGSGGAIYAGQIAPIPEPETYAMLLAGLGLMGAVVRRRSMRK
ncbi:MAG: PEP-CTERM sorting domain-containing protein [Nitrosospira sp.]|nr:PEP-CTERM sorting domain-containing protein [Nitrosospira sp.]